MEDRVNATRFKEFQSSMKWQILIFQRVGRRPGEGGIHANVAFVARKRPKDDATLHWLRNAVVSLFDPLEGNLLSHDTGANVEERVGRSATGRGQKTHHHFGTAIVARAAARHADSAAATAAAGRRSARGGHSLSSAAPCLVSVCVCVGPQTKNTGRQAGREEEQGAYGFLGCRVHCCCTHTHTGPTNSIRETHDDYTTRTAGKWWLARHSTLVLHHHFRFDVCFPSFFLLFLATTSWPNEEEEASNPF